MVSGVREGPLVPRLVGRAVRCRSSLPLHPIENKYSARRQIRSRSNILLYLMPICQLSGRFVVLFYCLFVVKFGLLWVGESVSRQGRAAHGHGRMPGLFPKVPGEKTKVLTVFPKVRIEFPKVRIEFSKVRIEFSKVRIEFSKVRTVFSKVLTVFEGMAKKNLRPSAVTLRSEILFDLWGVSVRKCGGTFPPSYFTSIFRLMVLAVVLMRTMYTPGARPALLRTVSCPRRMLLSWRRRTSCPLTV